VNGSASLSWTAQNATSCIASGGWSGAKATTGTENTGPLASTVTYTLACTGAGGEVQQSATITVTPPSGGGAGALAGRVDSSLIDVQGDNRVYIFAGDVAPDDDDGDAGDPLQRVVVTQADNGCTFAYSIAGLAAGTYTVAFTRQAQLDADNAPNDLAFVGRAVITIGSGAVARDFAGGNVLRVGPSRPFTTIAAAAAAANTGDTIEIDAGDYPDDVVVWRDNSVTVRAVGGRAHVRGTRTIPFESGNDRNNGKGLWVVRGTNMRIENIEFSGARVTDENGAGIRNEGRNLTICNCIFRDSENGILGAAIGQFTIEYSTFTNNGLGEVGRTHNLYVDEGSNAGDRLVFRHNSSTLARIGHLLKSRARENWILYNRLLDDNGGTASYEIDIPNGGETYVIGNLIQQGPQTDNPTIIAYGAEGLSGGRTHALYAVHNTIVNDRSAGTFFSVPGAATTFRATNNLYVGPGTLYSGLAPQQAGNVSTANPGFVNRAAFDYRLTAGSPAINAGVDAGTAGSVSLQALYQFVAPAAREPRAAVGAPDAGALEFR
jgi:hypothetical protein